MSTEKVSVLADRGDVLTTELDALANGSFSAVGTELANQTNKDRFAVAELEVDFVSAPTDFSTCDLYAVTALDGTNYPDGGGATRPSQEQFVASFQLLATTSAQRLHSAPFELLGGKTKFILKNNSGQAFPASGSTVRLYTFNRETQ